VRNDELVRKYNLPLYFSKYGYCNKVEFKWFMSWVKKLPKNVRILDCCCGIALLAVCLNRMGYTRYYGLDKRPEYVEAGRELITGLVLKGTILEGDAHNLTSHYSGWFDVVTMFDVSYFSGFDLRRVSSEVYKVLDSGGWYVFDVAERKRIPSEVELYSRSDVRDILKEYSEVSFDRMSRNKVRWMVVARK